MNKKLIRANLTETFADYKKRDEKRLKKKNRDNSRRDRKANQDILNCRK